MSPRDFSGEVLQVRLGLMRDLLDDLDAVGEVKVASLEQDRLTRRAIERILTPVETLPPEPKTSEESVQPESETLFY